MLKHNKDILNEYFFFFPHKILLHVSLDSEFYSPRLIYIHGIFSALLAKNFHAFEVFSSSFSYPKCIRKLSLTPKGQLSNWGGRWIGKKSNFHVQNYTFHRLGFSPGAYKEFTHNGHIISCGIIKAPIAPIAHHRLHRIPPKRNAPQRFSIIQLNDIKYLHV